MEKDMYSRRKFLWTALAGAAAVTSCVSSNKNQGSGANNQKGSKVSLLYFKGLAEGARIRSNLAAFKAVTGIEAIQDELPYDDIRARQMKSFRAATSDYDVIFVDDIWMYEYARKGYIHELSDLVRRDNFDFDDLIPRVVEAESVLDGKTWLIPQRADVQVLFYNKAIFDSPEVREQYRSRTGGELKIPETWQEYAAIARGLHGLKFAGDTLIGCAETLKRPHFAFEFFATRYWSMTGHEFFDQTNKPLFNDPSGVAALEYLSSLKDVWAPGSLGAGHDESVTTFTGGRTAMMPQWFAFYAVLKKAEGGLGERLGVSMMPGARSDNGSIRRAPSIGGGSLGISANTANVESAWQFIKFMTSRQIMTDAALDGEIITRKSAYENPEVRKRNPALDIYRQSLDISKFRPRSVAYAAIESAIGEGVSRALAGEATAAEALADAARTAQELNQNAS
jgi:multiple sugar transport system substrate-binding protein